MSSKRNPEANDGWQTPDYLREMICDFAVAMGFKGITLDPATTKGNPMQAEYIRTPDCDPDGLETDWFNLLETSPRFVYANPPYRAPWWKKIHNEATRMPLCATHDSHMLTLLPAKVGTVYFQDLAATSAGITFVRGRLVFNDPETGKPRINPKTGQHDPAAFESALMYWGQRRNAFLAHFETLGWAV